MVSKSVAVALAFSSAAYAAPALRYRQDKCQDAYKACIAAGTPEVACSCTLTACVGEDNARNRDYCASATASLKQPSSTSIPGGCNPAHPGSCPSSYFSTLPSAPVTTSIPGGCNPAHPGSCPSSYFSTLPSVPVTTSIPGGCNPAHPGSCPSSYFSTLPSTPVATSIPGGCNPAHPGSCPSSYFSTLPSTPVATSIPGGCNPAHPGSCPSSYFSTIVVQPTPTSIPGGCNPAHPGSCPTPSAAQPSAAAPSVKVAPGSNPTKVDGKTWTIANLTRYCGEGNTGCDYNFAIQTSDKTERCTVIRMPGSNAATESWSNQPCTDGSEFTVSWGYAPNPAPAFAVVTVVKGKELAWFGVSDVNGQKVTASNPFGSGEYGNLGPEQVYTY